MKDSADRLRIIGYIEGVSFLVLLLIAMPLKYLADRPEAVRVVGTAHGVLWVLFIMALVHAVLDKRWSFKVLFAGFVASVLPFGPFVFEKWLQQPRSTA